MYMYFITVTVAYFPILYFTIINEETHVYTVQCLWYKMHKLFVYREFYCTKNLKRTLQKLVYREWTQHTSYCPHDKIYLVQSAIHLYVSNSELRYSITLGGHTEGWKITVFHKQTILMSSENKDVVMATITHSRIKRWQKLWVTCESCKLHPKVWNMSHLQLFTKSTLFLLQDTFKR